MKKLLIIFVAIVCFATIALAEQDLSEMSFDELIDLRDKINAEITKRPEWKGVEVPAGEWIVGVDIPEGTYSVTTDAYVSIIHVWTKPINDEGDGDTMKPVSIDNPIGKLILNNGDIFINIHTVYLSQPKPLGF